MKTSTSEKACPKCGQAMKAGASVCPHCDYVAPVFKYKLFVGCMMLVILAILLAVTMWPYRKRA